MKTDLNGPVLAKETAYLNDSLFQGSSLLIGNRIPRDFFEVEGSGESDVTIHAGSFHLALQNAGIERYNIMTYSSILPGIARKVPPPRQGMHGAVLESILSVSHAASGETATAGLIYAWLYDRVTGKRYGGLVCEHNGSYPVEELYQKLQNSLRELYEEGFARQYELRDPTILWKSFVPSKRYGTALVGLCFSSYVYPLIRTP